jgi:polyferredoxin
MNDYVKAWQCIGCGKIEAPQTCIGVCQDRKVEFVYAAEHKETLAQLALARRQASVLEALVRRLACTTPRQDGWEHSYRAMQAQARSALAALGGAS